MSMRPGNRETTPTVAEVVRDAAAICDPQGADTAVTALLTGFEDDDRPTTAVEDLRGELGETVRAIDGEDPAALAAVATATWLATNPGQAGNGDHALTEGVRLVYEGRPPGQLADWLAARGVEV
jgi:hypothetical protein